LPTKKVLQLIMGRKHNKAKYDRLRKSLIERNEKTKELIKEVEQSLETLRTHTIKMRLSTTENILNMNRALIDLMETINNSEEGKVSTRELLREMGSFNVHRLLVEGEELGFIKREPDKNRMVNYLSEQGQALLQAAARHNKTQT
jgi:hypothetical protein